MPRPKKPRAKKPSAKTKAARTPTGEVWVLACRDVGVQIQGQAGPILIGLVQSSTGFILASGPVMGPSDLPQLLIQALRAAPHPQAIRCEGASLAAKAQSFLSGQGIRIVAEKAISDLDAPFGALARHLRGPPPDLGFQGDRAMLGALARRFHALAPWRLLREGTSFHFFHGAGLDRRCAIITGALGESFSFILFEDGPGWLAMRSGSPILTLEALDLEFLLNLSPSERREASTHDLVVAGTLAPKFIGMVQGHRQAVSAAGQQRLTLALTAVLELIESHTPSHIASCMPENILEHVYDHQGESIHFAMVSPPDPDYALTIDKITTFFSFSRDETEPKQPTFFIKAAKADAQRIALQLVGMDGLELVPEPGAQLLGLWTMRRNRRQHKLHYFVAPPKGWRPGPGYLVVSAGGARRQSFSDSDLLLVQEVTLGAAP